eukprot:10959498-Alexandrium_andersonii.AAC.1
MGVRAAQVQRARIKGPETGQRGGSPETAAQTSGTGERRPTAPNVQQHPPRLPPPEVAPTHLGEGARRGGTHGCAEPAQPPG